ncbi:MAG: hypothetical protein J2P38_03395 [Candidatus Dormibacteraeota bacterium]|nr:hypothetical protein [Candidatus Dormibacteraeota bacterium]
MAPPKTVNFNQQLASAAVDELNKLRANLRKFQEQEQPLRRNALKDWRGPDADTFTQRAGANDTQVTNMITVIGNTIQAIQEGAAAAKTQNAKAAQYAAQHPQHSQPAGPTPSPTPGPSPHP